MAPKVKAKRSVKAKNAGGTTAKSKTASTISADTEQWPTIDTIIKRRKELGGGRRVKTPPHSPKSLSPPIHAMKSPAGPPELGLLEEVGDSPSTSISNLSFDSQPVPLAAEPPTKKPHYTKILKLPDRHQEQVPKFGEVPVEAEAQQWGAPYYGPYYGWHPYTKILKLPDRHREQVPKFGEVPVEAQQWGAPYYGPYYGWHPYSMQMRPSTMTACMPCVAPGMIPGFNTVMAPSTATMASGVPGIATTAAAPYGMKIMATGTENCESEELTTDQESCSDTTNRLDSVQSVLTLYQKVVKLCKNGYSMNKAMAQVNKGLHSFKRTQAIAILYITDYTKFEEIYSAWKKKQMGGGMQGLADMCNRHITKAKLQNAQSKGLCL